MCVWANYSNNNDNEYGVSFVLVIVAWLLLLLATVVGYWERVSRVPEGTKRVFNLSTYAHSRA
jgi:hypothetical protein